MSKIPEHSRQFLVKQGSQSALATFNLNINGSNTPERDEIVKRELRLVCCLALLALAGGTATLRAQPTLRYLPPYYADDIHIAALAEGVRTGLEALDFTPDVLLASYHGMPQRTYDLGDPYYDQCRRTTELLAEKLARPVDMAFQSRFGKAKWLEPATDTQLEQWGRDGKSITIFAPGFSADCIETLEELALRGREAFQAAGGVNFAYIPCLNDTDTGMAMLESLVRRELAGWIEP